MSVPVTALADPRPTVVEEAGSHLLEGGLCVQCGHALAVVLPRCPRCRGRVAPRHFGPEGTVWSFTVVHIAARPGGETPYVLGYIDLDSGPRVLLRLDRAPARVGSRVRLAAPGPEGNPSGEVLA